MRFGFEASRAGRLDEPLAHLRLVRREQHAPEFDKGIGRRLVRSPNTVVGFEGLLLLPRGRRHTVALPLVVLERRHVPTRTKAAMAWREERGTAADAPTPFRLVQAEGSAPRCSDAHARARDPPELAASRLGHKDAGHLRVTCTPRRGARTCAPSSGHRRGGWDRRPARLEETPRKDLVVPRRERHYDIHRRDNATLVVRMWSRSGLRWSGMPKFAGRNLVRMRGLEPPRPYGHTDLNRARLPIPPHPRGRTILASGRLTPR